MKYIILVLCFVSCQSTVCQDEELITICDHLTALEDINKSILSNSETNKGSKIEIRERQKLLNRKNDILQSFNDKQFHLSDSINCR